MDNNSKKCPADKIELGKDENTNINDTSLASQRQRLLERLKQKPIDTIEARTSLNVMSPAPRVRELRLKGYNIVTHRITAFDAQGRPHKGVGQYALLNSREAGNG